MRWVALLGISAPDHYRRMHSKDCLVVPLGLLKRIPTSNHDPVEYIPRKDPTDGD